MDGSPADLQPFRGDPLVPRAHTTGAGLGIDDPNRLNTHQQIQWSFMRDEIIYMVNQYVQVKARYIYFAHAKYSKVLAIIHCLQGQRK